MRRRNLTVFMFAITLCAAGLLIYNSITSSRYVLFTNCNVQTETNGTKWQSIEALANDNELAQRNDTTSKHNVAFTNCNELVQKTNIGFNQDDFCHLDLVAENMFVDKLSPALSSNHEVIEEAQRIHWNMFKTLIGHYKYTMLFNFAAFENKGDPAITVGELKIIRKLGIKLIFHCPTLHCKGKTLEYAKKSAKGTVPRTW